MSIGIRALPTPPNTRHAEVVYYIGAIGLGIVRIGKTVNLSQMMRKIKAFSPGVNPVLLAWEYGGTTLLHKREESFNRDSRVASGWYALTPEINKWILYLGSDQPNFPEQI